MDPLDALNFIVTPADVHEALTPLALSLRDPVTHEVDEERGRQIFQDVVSNAMHSIEQHIAMHGGSEDHYRLALETFVTSLQAGLQGYQ